MAEALQLIGICSVAVQVRNLDRSIAFYREVLGLRLEDRQDRIAQLHGQVALPRRSSCLRSASVPFITPAARASPGSRASRQAELDLAEHLLKSHGYRAAPARRRRRHHRHS
jgi:catechol 2,3-dioxygenase-like lactoylglutathione lyase family enzyme